jgi:D-arabinose 1-dehydrogenase-like Zn-dependent alcohol dehydrogenase
MEALAILMVPAAVGGLVLAILLFRFSRRTPGATVTDVFSAERLSSEVINASRIRVAGVGGLGLVAMALTVAIGVPGVGVPLALGGALGIVLAAVLIVRNRRNGPLPSSGGRPGANTVLSIEAAGAPEVGDTGSRSVDQGGATRSVPRAAHAS